MAMMVERRASTSNVSTPMATTVTTPVVVPVPALIQSPLSKKASTEAGQDLSAMIFDKEDSTEALDTFDSQIAKALTEAEEKPTEDQSQEEEKIVSPVQFDLKHGADEDEKKKRKSRKSTIELTDKENITEHPAKVALVTAGFDEPQADKAEAIPTAVVDKQMSSSKGKYCS